MVEKAQAGTRFSLLLIGVFATVAALLAGVGLYGVLSTVVRQRTAEIGVRMALGAAPGSIFSLVVGQGLRLSAAGIAAGLMAALALTRVMTSMLVGVKADRPDSHSPPWPCCSSLSPRWPAGSLPARLGAGPHHGPPRRVGGEVWYGFPAFGRLAGESARRKRLPHRAGVASLVAFAQNEGVRVLLVEDESRVAGFIAKGLREQAYAVDLAARWRGRRCTRRR